MTLPMKFSINDPVDWLREKDKLLDTANLISGRPLGLDHTYYEKDKPFLKAGI